LYMPDVPLYTAVISGCAAVVGAAIPTISAAAQNIVQARRDGRDQIEEDKRQAAVQLMQAVENLRAQVASNHDYHGDEMGARLALVREYGAEARVQSLRISLMATSRLAASAQELAEAATRLEKAAEATTDVDHGVSPELPGFGELEMHIAAFRAEAVSDARGAGKLPGADRARPAGLTAGATMLEGPDR
jgi:hypothetical protein